MIIPTILDLIAPGLLSSVSELILEDEDMSTTRNKSELEYTKVKIAGDDLEKINKALSLFKEKHSLLFNMMRQNEKIYRYVNKKSVKTYKVTEYLKTHPKFLNYLRKNKHPSKKIKQIRERLYINRFETHYPINDELNLYAIVSFSIHEGKCHAQCYFYYAGALIHVISYN